MIILLWQFFAGIHVKHQNMKKLGWTSLLWFQFTSTLDAIHWKQLTGISFRA